MQFFEVLLQLIECPVQKSVDDYGIGTGDAVEITVTALASAERHMNVDGEVSEAGQSSSAASRPESFVPGKHRPEQAPVAGIVGCGAVVTEDEVFAFTEVNLFHIS